MPDDLLEADERAEKPCAAPPVPDDLLEVDEVARITRRTKRTVRRWAQRRTIRHWKLFGRIFFSRRDIEAAMTLVPGKH